MQMLRWQAAAPAWEGESFSMPPKRMRPSRRGPACDRFPLKKLHAAGDLAGCQDVEQQDEHPQDVSGSLSLAEGVDSCMAGSLGVQPEDVRVLRHEHPAGIVSIVQLLDVGGGLQASLGGRGHVDPAPA